MPLGQSARKVNQVQLASKVPRVNKAYRESKVPKVFLSKGQPGQQEQSALQVHLEQC